MPIKPMYDRLVVERKERETKTRGGIIIPDNSKEKPIEGVVRFAGDGKLLENGELSALKVKVGDTVLFGKYAGTEIKHDDKEYVIMREDDILAIVE